MYRKILVIMLACIFITACKTQDPVLPVLSTSPLSELQDLPMYGGIHQLTPANEAERKYLTSIKAADEKLINSILQAGVTRKSASIHAIKRGWESFKKQDYDTALKRFNQAWLLNPKNGDLYYGFALIVSVRNGPSNEVEEFFKIAISKPDVSPAAYVDYGRFLWTERRLDSSLALLHKAMEIEPTVFNARSHISFVYYLKKEFEKACEWAKLAEKNGDDLENGYLEDMCKEPSSNI